MDHPAPPTDKLVRMLLKQAAISFPRPAPENDEQLADSQHIAREIFAALNPRDAAEAQLATLAIAAGQAAMDNFARAARPNVSNDAAARLRSSAMAAKRAYMQTLLYFRPQQKAALRRSHLDTSAQPPVPATPASKPNGQPVRMPSAMQLLPLPLPPGAGAPAHHSPAAGSP